MLPAECYMFRIILRGKTLIISLITLSNWSLSAVFSSREILNF
jgi:hypothetical protein